MSHLEVTCTRCKSHVVHTCNPEIKRALLRLYLYKQEFKSSEQVAAMKDSGYYAEGDEEASFFSEAFLYNLVGKEDARTVLALISNLCESMGLGEGGFREELYRFKRAQDVVADNHKLIWELAQRRRESPKKEELDALLKERVRLMDEQLPAQQLLDTLDRFGAEKPEEKPRAALLSAITQFALDDKMMASLQHMDADDFEDELEDFFEGLHKKDAK